MRQKRLLVRPICEPTMALNVMRMPPDLGGVSIPSYSAGFLLEALGKIYRGPRCEVYGRWIFVSVRPRMRRTVFRFKVTLGRFRISMLSKMYQYRCLCVQGERRELQNAQRPQGVQFRGRVSLPSRCETRNSESWRVNLWINYSRQSQQPLLD